MALIGMGRASHRATYGHGMGAGVLGLGEPCDETVVASHANATGSILVLSHRIYKEVIHFALQGERQTQQMKEYRQP